MKKYLWILPFALALLVYSVALDNFFVFDDFIWLNRARTLGQDWRQAFGVDVIYFDPLVYLSFFLDSLVGGLEPAWYHGVDLLLHAVNTLLVCRLAYDLSGDRKAALYSGICFATSFAVADAVLWPSSRVDLMSVLFTLAALISFLSYLRSEKPRLIWISSLCYLLALGAKGTPTVLPLILAWLLAREGKPARRFGSLVPFAVITVVYFALLKLALAGMHGPITSFHLSLRNLCLALSAFFIPEPVLVDLDPLPVALIIALTLGVLGLSRFSGESASGLRRTGFVVLAAGLLPVVVLNEFKLASADSPVSLLSSPSHRIYLASVGMAMLVGGILRWLETVLARFSGKAALPVVALVLGGILLFNASQVLERDRLWQKEGNATRKGLQGLLAHHRQIREDGYVVLINFHGSRGFFNPMLKTYFGLYRITTAVMSRVGPVKDPEILERAERGAFFVLGKGLRVYDFSDQFRQMLVLNRQALLDPSTKEYRTALQTLVVQLNTQMRLALP